MEIPITFMACIFFLIASILLSFNGLESLQGWERDSKRLRSSFDSSDAKKYSGYFNCYGYPVPPCPAPTTFKGTQECRPKNG